MMEELLINNIEYTLPLDEVRSIVWAIQSKYGENAAHEFIISYLAKFN